MVYTYFEIGKMIVENEQKGKERAKYGNQTLKTLSERLTDKFGKGFSVDNLQNMRSFYLAYSIYEKPSSKFNLSWSHYLKLMRIDNIEERNFYEIECINNSWSLKELQRQFDTGLYERLSLSRNKEEIKKLSEKGQMYVNYYDRFVKTEDKNPTIGIILCKEKNNTLVEITLPKDNNQIFASKYQTFLPSKEELKELLEKDI